MGKNDPWTGRRKNQRSPCGTGNRLHVRRNSPHQISNERRVSENIYGEKNRLTTRMTREKSSHTKKKIRSFQKNTAMSWIQLKLQGP